MARGPGRPRNPIPREVMVSRAAEVFAAEGYAGASMGSIATRCSLQKSSLFHHFGSKLGLYLEVLSTYIGELGRLVVEADGASSGFEARLDTLGGVVTDYLGAHPHAAGLILRELMDQGPYVSGPGGDAVQAILRLVEAFLQGGIDQGIVAAQDTRHLTLSIASVHLTWFAVHEVSGALADGSIFDPGAIASRKASVRTQVRRLCGLAIDRSVD